MKNTPPEQDRIIAYDWLHTQESDDCSCQRCGQHVDFSTDDYSEWVGGEQDEPFCPACGPGTVISPTPKLMLPEDLADVYSFLS